MTKGDSYSDRLSQAKKFADMTPIALEVLKKISAKGDIVQVCGPISTGGFCCKEKNLLAMSSVVRYLEDSGYNVFDQTIFERHIQRIWEATTEGYPTKLLENFYQEIFETGMIKKFIFLPSWETSKGTKWERRQARRLNIFSITLSWKEFYHMLK